MPNRHEANRESRTQEQVVRPDTRETTWAAVRRGTVAAFIGAIVGLAAVAVQVAITDPLENMQDPLGGLAVALGAAAAGSALALVGYLVRSVPHAFRELPAGSRLGPIAVVVAAGLVVSPAVSILVMIAASGLIS